MFGNYFKHVLILTLLAGLTYSLPQVKEAMAGAFTIGYTDSSAYTAAVGDLGKVAPSPINVKEITAKVVYDSKHQESSIAITAKVQVTATVSDLYISDTSFYFSLKNTNFNITTGAQSSKVTSNLSQVKGGLFMIKKGTTALFSVMASANPKSMIAGQYTTSLEGIIANDIKLQVPANKSNTFVVVGEASPYITLVGQGLYGSKDTLVLNAVRLGRSPSISFKSMYDICPADQVCVPSTPKTFSLKGNFNSKQINFNLSGKDIPAGQYYVYVTNNELGSTAGKSNSVSIQILDQSKILTAQAIAGKLALTYDAQNQEASLAAQFEVIIKAGNESLTFDSNSFYVSGASQVVLKSVNGQVNTLPYTLPAGKEARFLILASNNPKIMFAGQYSMSVRDIYPSTISGNKVYIQVGENQTNTVTIIGEVSPYITGVTNPATAGQQFKITGQRLNGVVIFIDGAVQYNLPNVVAPDGTTLIFTLPSTIQDGFHMLQVKNEDTGASNIVWFESVGGPVVPPQTITIISPNGGEIYKVGDTVNIKWNTIVNSDTATIWLSDKYGSTVGEIKVPTPNTGNYSWVIPENIVSPSTSGAFKIFMNINSNSTGEISSDYSDNYFTILGVSTSTCYTFTSNLTLGSVGADVVALQAFLSSHGFQGTGSFQQGVFDESTKAAVIAYQTSLGQAATGFVGPITRAALNAGCTNPTPVCPAGYVCTPGTPTDPQPVNCPVGFVCTIITSTSQIISRVDPSSPVSRTIQLSDTAETDGVVLGVFDLKSQNISSTLRKLEVTADTSRGGMDSLFSEFKIKIGNSIYFPNSVVDSTFNNLSVALPQDQYVPVTFIGKFVKNINNSLNGITISVGINANNSNIVAEGPSGNQISVTPNVLTSSILTIGSNSAITPISITSLSPLSGVAGTKGVGDPIVTIYGSGFNQPVSVLITNPSFGSSWGLATSPSYISPDGTTLTFTFPGSGLLTLGDYSIRVTNAYANITSNPLTFTLTASSTLPTRLPPIVIPTEKSTTTKMMTR
jgi:hypothetical protein